LTFVGALVGECRFSDRSLSAQCFISIGGFRDRSLPAQCSIWVGDIRDRSLPARRFVLIGDISGRRELSVGESDAAGDRRRRCFTKRRIPGAGIDTLNGGIDRRIPCDGKSSRD
jgi:hypothetical protein